MSVTVKKETGWGNCVKITNGKIELSVSTAFGPRILGFGFVGKDNFMHPIEDPSVGSDDPAIKAAFGTEKAWSNYGGHRLWHSPEAMPRTYYPDHDEVQVIETADSLRFLPPKQVWTGLQNEIEITMDPEKAEVQLLHKVTNCNPFPVEFAPWAISVMAEGGLEVIPLPDEDTGLLSNGGISLWPYGKMNDYRVYWGEKYVTLYQNPQATTKFKFGVTNTRGFTGYFLNGDLFTKSFSYEQDKTYPDRGMNFETYTDGNIIECETVSYLQTVQPGQTARHVEIWNLYENVGQPAKTDEQAIDEIIKTYVKK